MMPNLWSKGATIGMTGLRHFPSHYRWRIAVVCVSTGAALLTLSACAGGKNSSPRTAESTSSTAPASNGFQQYDEAEKKLVTANARWRRPKVLTVDHGDPIGLRIESGPVESQINDWMQSVPGTDQPAGQIRVSPNATARLVASDDATVMPSDYQNQSSGSNVDLQFLWTVTPKKPTSHLILTAYIDVHLEGIPPPKDTITTAKILDIPVEAPPPVPPPPPVHKPLLDRIWSGIKDNAPVWSPFVGTSLVAGIGAWILKKRRSIGAWIRKNTRHRKQAPDVSSSAGEIEQTPTEAAEPLGDETESK
jgi:hypothetical protein